MAVNVEWPCWVGVVAEDLTTQRRFYRDVLGLPELAAGPGWVQFDFGQAGVLEIVQRSDSPQYDQVRYQGRCAERLWSCAPSARGRRI